MSYFAKLVKGQDYTVSGIKFLLGVEHEVAEDLHDYLQDNPQFKVREGDSKAAADLTNDDKEAAELAKKSREDLNELAEALELNPKDYSNRLEIAKAIIAAEKAE
jgi:hypothetical protein